MQFRSSKHLWFLFLSQELGENRQRTSLFSCMTSYLHIFVRQTRPNREQASRFLIIEPAIMNCPGLDIVSLQLNWGGWDGGCVCCRFTVKKRLFRNGHEFFWNALLNQLFLSSLTAVDQFHSYDNIIPNILYVCDFLIWCFCSFPWGAIIENYWSIRKWG